MASERSEGEEQGVTDRRSVPCAARLKRGLRVSVYLTDTEFQILSEKSAAAAMTTASYLRASGLESLPPVIPSLNREAWLTLRGVAANLNQAQHAVNAGLEIKYPESLFDELKRHVDDLRCRLIGVSRES